jgi:MFS transporter, OFA family, oxalate/formate antiporter
LETRSRKPGEEGRTALAAAILTMFSIGALYAWSVFVEPLQSLLGQSRAAVSAVFSIANVGFMLGLLIGPLLQRRYGRPFTAALTFLLASSGIGLSGLWPSVWVVWIGFGALFGIANGIGYVLSLEAAQAAMPHRPGLASGIAVTTFTLGAMVFAPMFGWGIARVGPLDTLLATAAFMVVVGAVIFGLLLASEPAPQLDQRIATPLKNPNAIVFWLLWCGFLFGSLTGLLVLGHAAAIAQSFGESAQLSALTVSLVAASNSIGRLAGGWAGDKGVPSRQASLLQMLACGGVLLVLIFPGPIIAAVGLALVGMGYGWMAGAYPVIVTKLYGMASMSTIYGRLNTAWGIAGMTASYMGGFLFDAFGNYQLALAASAATALCAAISIGLVVPTKSKPPRRKEQS